MGQATKENESNLASPAISPSAPPLEVPEGQEPSYHERDSGWDEEMEEEQSPLVEEALVQLCDKEIQTIEIASIGSSKKVYPSLLTATRTVAADPSGIPFKERWNEIQGTLKRLTLALEAQQKMGQPHPERRDSPVSKAETAPLERAGFDPVQPISSEQTKEKTVEQKTEKGLEQKGKQPVESKEEKPRVLPVNMQKRQRKVTPLEAVLQAQDQGEDTQEFFAYPVLERPGDNGETLRDAVLQSAFGALVVVRPSHSFGGSELKSKQRSKQFSAYIGSMFLTLLCSIQSVGSLPRTEMSMQETNRYSRSQLEKGKQDLRDLTEKFLTSKATADSLANQLLKYTAFPESGTQKPGAPRAAIHGDAAAVAGTSGSRVSIGH
ncbi:Neuroblastoma Breakpoint Family Member 5-Like [Manis pentadactyla]|nr:Neuroblastoma Breakpoint Family Member 5-Like [Manis pentadactyla]